MKTADHFFIHGTTIEALKNFEGFAASNDDEYQADTICLPIIEEPNYERS